MPMNQTMLMQYMRKLENKAKNFRKKSTSIRKAKEEQLLYLNNLWPRLSPDFNRIGGGAQLQKKYFIDAPKKNVLR